MGRRYRRQSERRQFVAEWRASGDTVGAFCASRGLAPASLNRWIAQEPSEAVRLPRKERNRNVAVPTKSAPSPLAVGFLRLERATIEPRGGITLEVGGARVQVERGFDAGLLQEIVNLLSKREGA